MNLWSSLAGMVEVEITSADPHSTFVDINNSDIVLYDIKKENDLCYRFVVYVKDYKKIAYLAEKSGATIKMCRKKGIYWSVKRLSLRPVLLIGILLFFVLALFLPSKILFVRVEGNDKIPVNRILEAAEKCGIQFGVPRRIVRSEKVKNALLSEIPELQWAGVNTFGCTAVISVRERAIPVKLSQSNGITSIVAARDGYLLSCTVTQGTLLCEEGQTVSEGQLLISGYRDCGICLQAGQAEGEIAAQTNRHISAIMPAKYYVRKEETESNKKICILFGKKRIKIWKDSGIWDSSCGRMYKEYYIALPGGFSLPFGLSVESFTAYRITEEDYPYDICKLQLQLFSDNYLKEQMISGAILNKEETVAVENGVYRLQGDYVCTEMIGKVQQEKIGE